MYSVEDLLISHGYKLPRSGPASSSSSAPYDNRNNECRRENVVENRPAAAGGGGTLNGFGTTEGGAEGSTGVYRPAPVKAYPENNNNINEGHERIQRRLEVPVAFLGDLQPLGDSLATDSGFYDAPSLTFSEHPDERDISFWRRRGQDFSALLDYADPRELRVSGGLWRGPVLAVEELRGERPLARWEEGPWIREPIDSGPETLRVTGERKCQSLGTEEWRPAVGLGRQLSDGEAEHWSLEQQHRLRPAEGNVSATVRAKSQSLPRVLSPEDPHYGELPQTSAPNQPPTQRSNSSAPYGRFHGEWPAGERWSGQTQSHGPSAVVPKPRFSRPVKPPSYETHQQNRGSWETLSSEPVSKPRDRAVCFTQSFEPLRDRSGCYSQSAEPIRDRSICFSQSAEPIRDRMISHSQSAEPLRDRFISHSQSAELLRDRFFTHSHSADLLRDRSLCYSQSSELLRDRSICYSQSAELLRPEAYRDLFYHELTGMEPPGYIPPPSYRRFLPPRSGQNYRADSALVRWKREPVSAEMGQWFSRTSGLSWSERREDRSMAVIPRRPVHPGPVVPSRSGLVQYVPFDDPRIRHVSGGPSGNSLTDADKIRHVNKELPCAANLGQSTHDSAFLPSQGQSLSTDTNKPALTEQENSNRWHKGTNKGSETVAPEQSCVKYPAAFQPRPLQPIIKTERNTDQQARTDRVTDQVKVERVTEPVKVERGAEQTRTDQVKVTEQVKPERVTDLIKLDKPTDQVKPDRFTDKQIKVERLTDQIQIDRFPDQVKADRYTDKQIKPEIKIEKVPEKPIKTDRVSDKQSKAERLLEKHLKIDRILEKQLKADKILEKQCKPDKFTDKLIKADKQAKGDAGTDQIKVEKITDKSGKADKSMDKGSSESVSTVKIEPVQEPEKKSVKKKLSETIFCLVSVPLSQSSSKSRDQNNNEEKEPDSPPIPPPPPPSSSSENSNTLGSLPNQSLKSTSTTSTDLELQALTLGSGSSSIATRRSHRRRNSRSRIIKPNPHDELRRYSGAWPGDQYRDQETQTSPEPTKSNAIPCPTNTEAQDGHVAPEVTAPAETALVTAGPAPGALGASSAPSAPSAPSVPSVPPTPGAPPASGASDPSTPYGYPMKGQKSLKPSSNSAFSRTGTFSKSTGSHRPPLHPPPHPPPPPPTQPPSQPPPPPPTQPPSPPSDLTEDAKSAFGPNPENSGQFLLKPVCRRPWDAIEELDAINKEAQEQASKRPSVDQCIEDLNEAYKDIMELSTASNNLPNRSSMQIPDRIKSRLSSDPLGMPATSLRPSLVPGGDPEYREVKSAFSRPSTGKSVSFSKQLREEICPAPPPPEPGFRDYKTVMSQITQRKACRSVKLDIPTPKETQRDDDLTLQTASTSSMSAEVPWAERQPMQDASTLTSPPDYEHICQTLQMARESGAVSRASVKSKPGSAMSIETPQHVPLPGRPPVDSEQPCCSSALEARQEPVSIFREERSSGFRRVTSNSNRFLNNRGVLCSLATGKPVGDKAGLEANPEVPADWQMQLLLAEKHIATLITGEGTEEDLDESNKVVGDKDIFASESVEKEVINIFASDIKDDSESAGQKCLEVKETEAEQKETPESQQTEVRETLREENTSREKTQSEQEKCEQNDPVTEGTDQKSDMTSEAMKEPNVILRTNKAAMWTHSGLDSEHRPEFPPEHLPLSVLPCTNRRLSLGLDWEKGGWEGESLGQGGFWSKERRSLDAERWGIGGESWGLDDDRQEGGGEKRGLGGWRGCGIDGQGTDDSDWELDKNTQATGGKEADSGTKQETLAQGLGEEHCSPASSTDKIEQKEVIVCERTDKGDSRVSDCQVSSVDRRSRGLSQRIEALFTAPPGHGSKERLARMKEVDTVSRMRRLSLRSSDSWDGLQGVGRWEDYEKEGECPPPDPEYSSNITKLEDTEGSTLPAVISEPKETKEDQEILKESQKPSQVERS
ncbi:uncharacterized protein jcadb isoform X2 [Danio rerio]|uniref:Uncharacterized protein jcadb isoform X2 n=1 Tax=Danio rerio TaxID=7955 RepID=A0A8M2BFR3_DANRE|nr:uncharacterized protein LOC101887100 [Danio rerio]|eukprot:XP_005168487.1 uncharacterized protein LOC101887100 [Danio rerio]